MAAIPADDADVFPALIDAQHLAAKRHGGFGGRAGAREGVEDGFAVPGEELDEATRDLHRNTAGCSAWVVFAMRHTVLVYSRHSSLLSRLFALTASLTGGIGALGQ